MTLTFSLMKTQTLQTNIRATMNAGLKDVEGDPERHRDDDEVVEEGP